MNPKSTQERDDGGIDSIITSTLQKHYKGLIFQEEHKEGLLQEKTHMSKIKSSSNKFDNFSMKKVASFPAILHTMLEDKHDSSISWWVDDSEELEESTSLDNAKLWRIVSITELEKILPLYFNHGKYNSFLRQIYRWGFKRYGSTRDCYYHELFRRQNPELILKMTCTKQRHSPQIKEYCNHDEYPHRLETFLGQGGMKRRLEDNFQFREGNITSLTRPNQLRLRNLVSTTTPSHLMAEAMNKSLIGSDFGHSSSYGKQVPLYQRNGNSFNQNVSMAYLQNSQKSHIDYMRNSEKPHFLQHTPQYSCRPQNSYFSQRRSLETMTNNCLPDPQLLSPESLGLFSTPEVSLTTNFDADKNDFCPIPVDINEQQRRASIYSSDYEGVQGRHQRRRSSLNFGRTIFNKPSGYLSSDTNSFVRQQPNLSERSSPFESHQRLAESKIHNSGPAKSSSGRKFIRESNPNDVIVARGREASDFSGNIQFQNLLQAALDEFLSLSAYSRARRYIARRIVKEINDSTPAGRFLKEDEESGLWYDAGTEEGIKMAMIALRGMARQRKQQNAPRAKVNSDKPKRSQTTLKASYDQKRQRLDDPEAVAQELLSFAKTNVRQL